MRRAGRQPESLWIPYNDPYSLGFHAAQRSGGSCAISSLGDSWPFVLLSLFNTLVGNSLKCFKAPSCSRLISSERGRDVCAGLEIGTCLSNRLPVWEGQRTSGTLLPQPCPCGGKGSPSTSHRHWGKWGTSTRGTQTSGSGARPQECFSFYVFHRLKSFCNDSSLPTVDAGRPPKMVSAGGPYSSSC